MSGLFKSTVTESLFSRSENHGDSVKLTGDQDRNSTVIQFAEQISDRRRMTGQNVIEGGQGEADDDAERIDAEHELVYEVHAAGDNRAGDSDEH